MIYKMDNPLSKRKNVKLAAFAYSKYRTNFGLVGLEILIKKKVVRVAFARQWSKEQVNEMPEEIGNAYRKFKWGDTYIDQLSGQSLIKKLRHDEKLRLKIINTQKNIKNPDNIEDAIVMDEIDMTQFMYQIKINNQLEFPPVPTDVMLELEQQISIFTEHKTEQGGLSYYAPGKELDNLVKALRIGCFAARKYLEGNPLKFIVESDVDVDVISILNKEVEEGKTGLSWIQKR